MILVDVNVLINVIDQTAPYHVTAKSWWESPLSDDETIGLPRLVLLGFLRITTIRQVYSHSLSIKEALNIVRDWLDHRVSIIHPGPRHFDILQDLLLNIGVRGSLTSDAYLAALAIETCSELYSFDHDFVRFPGLRWRNPAHFRHCRHS